MGPGRLAARGRLVRFLRDLRGRAEIARLAQENGDHLTDDEKQRLTRLLREPDPARAADALIAEALGTEAAPARTSAAQKRRREEADERRRRR